MSASLRVGSETPIGPVSSEVRLPARSPNGEPAVEHRYGSPDPGPEDCIRTRGRRDRRAGGSAPCPSTNDRPGEVESPLATVEAGEEAEITRRLRAQYAEISLLAGGLAHEIRNPLSTVQMNLDLMAEDFQDSETPRDRRVFERVQRLRHEVHRLHGILENFLRFACVQDLKLEAVDLNEVVGEICDFYEHNAASKSIVMRTQLASDLPTIELDVDLFKQALLNLVLNADHAMPSGGELILKTRREGRWIVLDVTDTGVGMTEEVRAGSSRRSSPPARPAAAWGCRPPARSSRPTAGRSTYRASPERARNSPSASPPAEVRLLGPVRTARMNHRLLPDRAKSQPVTTHVSAWSRD